MKYVYIFDYSFSHIYQISISNSEFNKIKDIQKWLYKNYHLKDENISYLISDNKLEIESINKY